MSTIQQIHKEVNSDTYSVFRTLGTHKKQRIWVPYSVDLDSIFMDGTNNGKGFVVENAGVFNKVSHTTHTVPT